VIPAYLLHHRLHAIQRAQQLLGLFRQVIQAFGRAHPHLPHGARWQRTDLPVRGDRSAPRRCGRPRSMRTSRLRCSAGRCLSSPPGRAGRRRASSGRRSSAPCDAAGCRPPAASMPPGPPPGTWPGHRGVGLAQDSDVRKARSAITSVKRWPVMPSASAPRTFAARLSMNTAWAALMPRSSSTCW